MAPPNPTTEIWRSTSSAAAFLRGDFEALHPAWGVLIYGGADVKTVQLAMGHSTPTVTLNTYFGHWPDAVDETRGLVAAALDICTRSVPVGRQ